MLTENIKALAESLDQYMDTGATFEPVALAGICAVLDDMATTAEALEEIARTIAHHHGLSEDILRIATLLARNGVSAGMPRKEGAE
ncbi:MAG: hypothetical protein H7Y60_09740 [Rhodospirillaceae bacterium]|nr:hypothetical protein [Rhodospirillales bacterium]